MTNKFLRELNDDQDRQRAMVREQEKLIKKYDNLASDLHHDSIHAKLVSVTLVGGKIEIVYRSTPNIVFPTFPVKLPKDVCRKYTLEAADSTICVISKTEGRIEPEQTIPEKFVYED